MNYLVKMIEENDHGPTSVDGVTAATAGAHQLTFATRSTMNFEGFGMDIIDPWVD